jgi:hypothetical protein
MNIAEFVEQFKPGIGSASVRAYLGKFAQEGKLKRKGMSPIAEKRVDPIICAQLSLGHS